MRDELGQWLNNKKKLMLISRIRRKVKLRRGRDPGQPGASLEPEEPDEPVETKETNLTVYFPRNVICWGKRRKWYVSSGMKLPLSYMRLGRRLNSLNRPPLLARGWSSWGGCGGCGGSGSEISDPNPTAQQCLCRFAPSPRLAATLADHQRHRVVPSLVVNLGPSRQIKISPVKIEDMSDQPQSEYPPVCPSPWAKCLTLNPLGLPMPS
ncbi:hypothetical protein RUM43_004262 [Polyplax serrata]|uniref:Uncharacterized protein n=1 Tax=Polyplax serrata TaxID=468196 RepID=A0AAN8XLM4_POLSC